MFWECWSYTDNVSDDQPQLAIIKADSVDEVARRYEEIFKRPAVAFRKSKVGEVRI